MLIQGDAVRIPLPDKSVHTCVTSPPYWGLRKYSGEQGRGMFPDLGLEKTPQEHIEHIVQIMAEVHRVLRDDGVVWLNYGDCYAGSGGENANTGLQGGNTIKASSEDGTRSGLWRRNPRKTKIPQGNLMLMPHRIAIALQDWGWIVRNDVVWWKRNPMPESVRGWSFIRHCVRISNHAYLSNMQEGNSNHENRNSGLSTLSKSQSASEATRISKDGKGQGSQSKIRTERKSQDISEEIQTIETGKGNPEEISPKEISGKSRRTSRTVAQAEQISGEQGSSKKVRGKPKGESEKKGSPEAIQSIPERSSIGAQRQSQEELESSEHRLHLDREGMERDQTETQSSMPLLQSEDGTPNDGSRNSIEQGGETYQGKRSTSLSELQQSEGSEALETVLVDCPGCEKCEANGGYILQKGSFRHTRAHEFIFMLTKKMQYFANQEAVREQGQDKGYMPRQGAKSDVGDSGQKPDSWLTDSNRKQSGRNPRSVMDVPTAPYKGAHYATFPPNLIAPLIRATCPRWACPVCGQGWSPVVETNYTKGGGGGPSGKIGTAEGMTQIMPERKTRHSNIKEYRPTCEHDHTKDEAVSGIVLDPFVGSGTTVMVAKQLLRRGIGLDISMEYIDQQAKIRTGEGSPSNVLDDLPLFAELES